MNKKEKKFVDAVLLFYKQRGRHHLPWRMTENPYHILVSEVMLQQTQVDRVIPKYEVFIKKYPTVQKLAKASLADVLKLWQGLGYNRRAKMLLACAQAVVRDYKAVFPRTEGILLELPGIGPYTAKAVLAFAFNAPVVLIETNVRTVYLHHFFHDKTDVTDVELLQYIERTNSTQNPREWYYALMDYGSHLKKTLGNQNSKSAHYVKQATFKDSDRQIRGAIIRVLAEGPSSRKKLLTTLSSFEDLRIDAQTQKLLAEGMISLSRQKYSLPA